MLFITFTISTVLEVVPCKGWLFFNCGSRFILCKDNEIKRNVLKKFCCSHAVVFLSEEINIHTILDLTSFCEKFTICNVYCTLYCLKLYGFFFRINNLNLQLCYILLKSCKMECKILILRRNVSKIANYNINTECITIYKLKNCKKNYCDIKNAQLTLLLICLFPSYVPE